jgi:hypothetical protein
VKDKPAQRLRQTVAPLLHPGEQVHLLGRATVARSFAQDLRDAVTDALSGRTGLDAIRVATFYSIVLTSHRLLMLEQNRYTMRPKPVIAHEFPRPGLYGQDYKQGITASFELAGGGQPLGVRLSFARPDREDGRRLGVALGAVVGP